MSQYNLIAATDESTVVAEYAAVYRTSAEYQSETALEKDFIRLLTGQGLKYLASLNKQEGWEYELYR